MSIEFGDKKIVVENGDKKYGQPLTQQDLEVGAKKYSQPLTQQNVSLPLPNQQTKADCIFQASASHSLHTSDQPNKADQLFQADLPSTIFSSSASDEFGDSSLASVDKQLTIDKQQSSGLIRIDKKLRCKIRHHAFIQQTTSSDLLNKIVSDWLEKNPLLQFR